MSIRRFGGGFQTNGSGDIKVASIGLALLVFLNLIALITAQPVFVILGFFALFIFSIISVSSPKGVIEEVTNRRKQTHLERAEKEFQEQNYKLALEYFSKAKIYGEIPDKYLGSYRLLKKNA